MLSLLPINLSGYLSAIAIAGLGFVVAAGVSWATNRKKGRSLQYVAAGGMIVAIVAMVVLNNFSIGPILNLVDVVGAGVGIYVAVVRLR